MIKYQPRPANEENRDDHQDRAIPNYTRSGRENRQLITAVFGELDQLQPDGFTYRVFNLEDELSFIHILIEHQDGGSTPLQDLPTFKAFLADIGERCETAPLVSEADIVGGYR